jgi:hypothetical protein
MVNYKYSLFLLILNFIKVVLDFWDNIDLVKEIDNLI